MTSACLHELSFLPWIGFWNKVASCDVYVGYTATKFNRHEFQHRVKFRGSMLSLPVQHDHQVKLLRDVRFDRRALPKIAARIRGSYGKKWLYADRCYHLADIIEDTTSDLVVDLNYKLFAEVASILCVKTRYALDSTEPDEEASTVDRVINRVKQFCTGGVYRSGAGGIEYLDAANFAAANMSCEVQQLKEGMSCETILDMLAKEEHPLSVIQDAATWKPLDSVGV